LGAGLSRLSLQPLWTRSSAGPLFSLESRITFRTWGTALSGLPLWSHWPLWACIPGRPSLSLESCVTFRTLGTSLSGLPLWSYRSNFPF
jgi:hypothetical protein